MMHGFRHAQRQFRLHAAWMDAVGNDFLLNMSADHTILITGNVPALHSPS